VAKNSLLTVCLDKGLLTLFPVVQSMGWKLGKLGKLEKSEKNREIKEKF
jgi:hypothetical protein